MVMMIIITSTTVESRVPGPLAVWRNPFPVFIVLRKHSITLAAHTITRIYISVYVCVRRYNINAVPFFGRSLGGPFFHCPQPISMRARVYTTIIIWYWYWYDTRIHTHAQCTHTHTHVILYKIIYIM